MDDFEEKLPKKPRKTYPASFSLRLSKQERKELGELAQGQSWGTYIKDVIFRQKRGASPRSQAALRISSSEAGRYVPFWS
jgi:hypothetical protein